MGNIKFVPTGTRSFEGAATVFKGENLFSFDKVDRSIDLMWKYLENLYLIDQESKGENLQYRVNKSGVTRQFRVLEFANYKHLLYKSFREDKQIGESSITNRDSQHRVKMVSLIVGRKYRDRQDI